MANAWILHVKQFASAHRMKYGDALKNPHCKASYHKKKQRNGGMLTNDSDHEDESEVQEVADAEINIPDLPWASLLANHAQYNNGNIPIATALGIIEPAVAIIPSRERLTREIFLFNRNILYQRSLELWRRRCTEIDKENIRRLERREFGNLPYPSPPNRDYFNDRSNPTPDITFEANMKLGNGLVRRKKKKNTSVNKKHMISLLYPK